MGFWVNNVYEARYNIQCCSFDLNKFLAYYGVNVVMFYSVKCTENKSNRTNGK